MREVPGNIVSVIKDKDADIVIQGCNCFCVQGAGVAGALRVFPEILKADGDFDRIGDRTKLGNYSKATIDGVLVINAYTQFGMDPSTKPVDYDAIREVFRKLAYDFGGRSMTFAYPEIGCGLAGGDWDIVSKIIDEELEGEDHFLIKWEPS